MTDSELYKSLSALTKNKSVWEEQIPYVESLLSADSVKIKSKALWMLGEMGLAFPSSIKNSVDAIARERYVQQNRVFRSRSKFFNKIEHILRICRIFLVR